MSASDLMAGRRWARGRCGLVMALTAAAVTSCSAGQPSTEPQSNPVIYSGWTAVSIGDVQTRTPYDGTVVAANALPALSADQGTVTRAAAPGTTLSAGDPIAAVDENPVVVVPGDVPMYRDLMIGASTTAEATADQPLTTGPEAGGSAPAPAPSPPEGQDVGQLQTFLTQAGYFTGAINGRFSQALGSSARSWRLDHGMSAQRGFTEGEIVFLTGSGPWVVTSTTATVGTVFAGGQLAEVTSGPPVITVSLDQAPDQASTFVMVPTGSTSGEAVPLTPTGPPTRDDSGKYVQLLAAPSSSNLTLATSVIVEQRTVLAADAIVIPVAAVRLDGAGRTVARCRSADDQPGQDCPITLGPSDGTAVAVTDGLTAGQHVATGP